MKLITKYKSFYIIIVIFFVQQLNIKTSYAKKRGKGYRIALKADKINSGFKGTTWEIIMSIIDDKKRVTKRRFSLIQKEIKGDGERSLITFKDPVDIKGTKLLTWAHDDKNDDQWLFLPGLQRVKRIASEAKSGAFMGSEFSYEDFIFPGVDKFKYKYIKDTKINGHAAWVIERRLIESGSGYSKEVTYIDKNRYILLKNEYYDRKGDLLKTARFLKIKKYLKWYRANLIQVINHQTRRKTQLKWTSQKLGVLLKLNKFNKSNLIDDDF